MPVAIVVILMIIILVIVLRPGYTPGIKLSDGSHGQAGIASLEKVTIGNSEQWIMIRSENIENPILLFVHGGPGTSQLTLMRKNTQPLEKYYTVVNWDQRGAGKSYYAIRDKSRIHINQFVSDIIELTQYLEVRFNKKKVTLAGHSWGSVIGVLAVSERPDLFNAYIGIGQLSNRTESETISYDWTLQQATSANDTGSIKKLVRIGPPPYTGDWRRKFIAQRRILGMYGGEYYGSKVGAFGVVIKNLILSTEYTFIDRINFFRGIFDSLNLLFPEEMTVNLFSRVPKLNVPVWFMLGRHDYEVPSVLSEQYFNALKAPAKEIFWFENSSHMPNTEERDAFNNIMIERILPAVKINQ
jgi:pimeloyl-ACP methyl ester carboxylesterase